VLCKILHSAWSSLKGKVKLFLIFLDETSPCVTTLGWRKFLRLKSEEIKLLETTEVPYDFLVFRESNLRTTHVMDHQLATLITGQCYDIHVPNPSIQIRLQKYRIWTSKFFLSQGCWPMRASGWWRVVGESRVEQVGSFFKED
jgi:hypothetical protein